MSTQNKTKVTQKQTNVEKLLSSGINNLRKNLTSLSLDEFQKILNN